MVGCHNAQPMAALHSREDNSSSLMWMVVECGVGQQMEQRFPDRAFWGTGAVGGAVHGAEHHTALNDNMVA